MAFVVRIDLRMGKGKIAAQVAHAAIGAVRSAQEKESEYLSPWLDGSAVKVVLKEDSEVALDTFAKQAENMGLTTFRMIDEGRTQVPEDSFTVLAIGPAPAEKIDVIVGHLKLM